MDPIFNYGKQYIDILKYIKERDIKSLVSLQTKFELISGKRGDEFLDLCSNINVVLEFGLQTTYEEENRILNRSTKIKHIEKVMSMLNVKGIEYEVNIIYGLPNQTVSSFKGTIEFLNNQNCKKIIAHPLMLLKGTELYDRKTKLKLKEEIINGNHYPIVTESESFTKSDWMQMYEIAKNI